MDIKPINITNVKNTSQKRSKMIHESIPRLARLLGIPVFRYREGEKNLKAIVRRERIGPGGKVWVSRGDVQAGGTGGLYEAVPGKRTRLKSKEEINKLKEANKSIKKSLEDAISRL